MKNVRRRARSRADVNKRIVAAVVALVGAAYVPALWGALQLSEFVPRTDLIAVLGLSLAFMWFSSIVTLGFAGPLFVLLWRAGRVGPWSSVIAGTAVGIIATVLLPLHMTLPYYDVAVTQSALSLASVGALSGAIFYGLLVGVSRVLRIEDPLTLEHDL